MRKTRHTRIDPQQVGERSFDHSLLAQAVENSTDLIAMANREGKFVFGNQSFLGALGCVKEEVIGKHFSAIFSANNPSELLQELGARMHQPSGWKGECLICRRDGTEFVVALSVGPVRDGEGRVIGSFGVAQDVTERRKVEEAQRRSEEQFRQLADTIREVFFIMNADPASMEYISPAYDEIWGRPRQQVLDRHTDWMQSVHPEERERVLGVLAQALQGAETHMDYRVVRPDGSIRWIDARSFPVRDASGNLIRVVGIAEDVTVRRDKERALEEARHELRRALEESKRLVAEAARLTELVDVLQSCQTLEEAYSVIEDALRRTLASRSGALCITSASRNLVEAVAMWGNTTGTEKTFRPDDCWALRRGKVHKIGDCASPLRCAHVSGSLAGGYLCVPLAAQGETLGVLYVECPPAGAAAPLGRATDELEALEGQAAAAGERISLAVANLRLRQTLRGQSVRDPLTGLYNRRYLEEALERELSRAVRNENPVALLMMDLDHFKRFNDTFGHQAGDKLLRALGDFITERTRGQDVACRYGGEEFAVILSGASLEAAVKRAELLRQELKCLSVEHAGQPLERVTLSIGVAAYPGHGATAEELVRAADQGLYRAKAGGRNRTIVFSDAPAAK